jgi:hypothetical protein
VIGGSEKFVKEVAEFLSGGRGGRSVDGAGRADDEPLDRRLWLLFVR